MIKINRYNKKKLILALLFFLIIFLFIQFSAAKMVVIEFDEPLTIFSMQDQSIGISKNVIYDIDETLDAKYETVITFTNYINNAQGSVYEDNILTEQNVNVGVTSVPWTEFDYILPVHINYNEPIQISLDKDVYFDINNSVFPTRDNPFMLIHLNPNKLESGTSFNLTVRYNISNFVVFDEKSNHFYYYGFEGFKSSRYIKNSFVNVRTIFPFIRDPRNPSANDVYVPYIALPRNGTSYDENMSVEIIQEDPLIVEFSKDLINDPNHLQFVTFFNLLPSSKLELTEKDEIILSDNIIVTTSDIRNYNSDRTLTYTIEENNNIKKIGIKLKTEEFQSGIFEKEISYGESQRILDEEPSDTNEPKLVGSWSSKLMYPFDKYVINGSKIIGNYFNEGEIPTDFSVDYYFNARVPDGFILDENNSYLKVEPLNMTFPNSFIYLMATGDFQGFLAKTDDTNIYKLSKVRTLPSTNLYKSEKINTLINLPLYEIKVEYNIIISRNPINILFSFLIAIVCPFISFISFKWTSKYNWVDRKIHYGGSFISSLVIFWSIWTYLFKNDSIELLFYHKALWAIVILFSILYCVPIIKNIFKKTMLKLSKIFCIIHNR